MIYGYDSNLKNVFYFSDMDLLFETVKRTDETIHFKKLLCLNL